MEKILISGTGRCGTTFLIKLFTFLDYDTGFNRNNYQKSIFDNCNSGMEKYIFEPNYVIKSPLFISHIDHVIRHIKIKYMIIPIRDYTLSANSRAKHGHDKGGFWNAGNLQEQINYYYHIMAEYLLKMVKYNIKTIFIDFDKMVTDSDYLYEKLKPILEEKNIGIDKFKEEYELASSTSKPKN